MRRVFGFSCCPATAVAAAAASSCSCYSEAVRCFRTDGPGAAPPKPDQYRRSESETRYRKPLFKEDEEKVQAAKNDKKKHPYAYSGDMRPSTHKKQHTVADSMSPNKIISLAVRRTMGYANKIFRTRYAVKGHKEYLVRNLNTTAAGWNILSPLTGPKKSSNSRVNGGK